MIINFNSYKGGVGKTTVATNTALALGAAILDLDGLRSSSKFNQIRSANGHEPLEVFTVETQAELQGIIEEFQGNKLLVVDSAGVNSDINRLVALSSDMLIVPTSPSVVEVLALTEYADFLKKTGEEYKISFKANVLINNVGVQSKSDVIELKSFISTNPYFDLFSTIIHSRIDFKKAFSRGQSVNEFDKKCKAAFEIKQFVKEIKADL